MKHQNITTAIGTINLSDISFVEDTLDVFIGIDSISPEIQTKINESVKLAKSDHCWNDQETETQLSLWVKIKNKKMTYCISVDIVNSDNGDFTSINIDIDLSDHQDDLKKIIGKALIDNFL